MYAVAGIAGVFLKLLGPMLKSGSKLELPFAAWHPYDTNKFWIFWISYVQQLVVGGTVYFLRIFGLYLLKIKSNKLINNNC